MTNNQHRNCLECEKDIATKRKDAKYCGDRCRMRYKRRQEKTVLIHELCKLCAQIPNHMLKNDSDLLTLKLFNATKKEHEFFSLKTLFSMNFKEIQELINRKESELKIYSMINPFFKK